jgi:hypothetical protein
VEEFCIELCFKHSYWHTKTITIDGPEFSHDYPSVDEYLRKYNDKTRSIATLVNALELVSFNTCLMATVDVAYTFSDIANYLVASEETESANGWYYSEWVGATPLWTVRHWARSSATHTPSQCC